jgi:hypothetical protein
VYVSIYLSVCVHVCVVYPCTFVCNYLYMFVCLCMCVGVGQVWLLHCVWQAGRPLLLADQGSRVLPRMQAGTPRLSHSLTHIHPTIQPDVHTLGDAYTERKGALVRPADTVADTGASFFCLCPRACSLMCVLHT